MEEFFKIIAYVVGGLGFAVLIVSGILGMFTKKPNELTDQEDKAK